MNDCEHALATNPMPVFVLDLTIIENSSFVQLYAATMNGSGERDLVGMEVLPARLALDFMWKIAKDVLYRVGAILNASVEGQV